MVGSCIVESRRAKHLKPDLASHRPGPAYQSVRVTSFLDAHEVTYFGNPLLGEETIYEDVRVRQVKLLVPYLLKDWMDFEATAFILVQ
jgi:hypothetical protein